MKFTKKFISVVLIATVLVSAFCVCASATTKSDLLEEASKSPLYKYVRVAVENAARTVEVTDEQAEKIMPLIKRGVALFPEDKGPTLFEATSLKYTDDQRKATFEIIDEICAILNYRYTTVTKANPLHEGDSIFVVYDSNNKKVFEYDGDAVTDTSAADNGNAVYVLAAAVLFAAGTAFAVSAKKRVED